MTIETILTDEEVQGILSRVYNYPLSQIHPTDLRAWRAIEQAVLQSDHILNMQGMADCMAMVRQELIEAGVINESVPPMMVANAVLFEMQSLRKDAERYRWLRDNSSVILDRHAWFKAESGTHIETTMPAQRELDAAIDAAMEQNL